MDHDKYTEARRAELDRLARADRDRDNAFIDTLDLSPANQDLAKQLVPQFAHALSGVCLQACQGDSAGARWAVAVCIAGAMLKSLQDSSYPAFVDACQCDECKKKEATHARV